VALSCEVLKCLDAGDVYAFMWLGLLVHFIRRVFCCPESQRCGWFLLWIFVPAFLCISIENLF
jgi:hypothetical protein